MLEINGYEVNEQSSTPIRTVYRGHHKTMQPHRSCTIEAFFEEAVPQCYRQLLKRSNEDITKPSNYYITQPEILLKHIFTSPQHPHQIFFVQYQPTSYRNHHQNPQKRFLSVFEIVRAVLWILIRGLVHDFSLENVAFAQEGIFFCNFVLSGRGRMNTDQMNRRVESIISELLQNQEEIFGNFSVDINDKLKSVSLKWRKKVGRGHIQMSYCFKLNQVGQEIVSITSQQCLTDQAVKTWQKQIPVSELKTFIPSYDFQSSKLHIPSIAKKKLRECALHVDELGGYSGGQTIVIDNFQREHPYDTVGALQGIMICSTGQTFPNFGTAFVVAENLIMTCTHNVICYRKDKIYKAVLENLKFVHNGISYAIQDIRYPKEYESTIATQNRYKYDYALLKLKLDEGQKVDVKLFPEIVQNYKETELGLMIKGFSYKKESEKEKEEENAIKARLAQGNRLKFMEKQKLLMYEYDSRDKGSEGGFSGGPIFIILAELAYGFKYHLLIGIHNSGKEGQSGKAIFFTPEIIQAFAQWQQELTQKKGKRFKNIYDFSKKTNMDDVCKTMTGMLDDIVFNPLEKEYLPKLFAQVKYQKPTNRHHIESMYKQAVPETGKKRHEILMGIESFKYQQRHNNIIFMYHLRDYQNWHAPWQSFGEAQGLFVFYIYIVLKLEYFFARAKVSKQRQQKFKDFQDFLAKQVDESYEKRYYCQVATIKIQSKIKQMQDWLKEISMNANLRKLLLFQVQFLKRLFSFLQGLVQSKSDTKPKPDTKLFEVSKICILGFLAKECFKKVVEVDKAMRNYLFLFNEVMLISIKYLLEEDKLMEAKEAKISFAWSVRQLIKDHPSLHDDYLRFDPNHQVFMSQEKRRQQEERENMIKMHIFGQEVRDYLKNCMEMLAKVVK